jgi:hypothetical protein
VTTSAAQTVDGALTRSSNRILPSLGIVKIDGLQRGMHGRFEPMKCMGVLPATECGRSQQGEDVFLTNSSQGGG